MDKPKNRWDVAAILLTTFLAAAIAVPAYGISHGFAPALWGWFAVLVLWNGLSITAGYHRLWSHRSYEAHASVRLFFALGGALSLQNSILQWCSNHRRHHRFVDDLDHDPYSARRGLLFSHVGWMLKDYPASAFDPDNVKDLRRDPIVEWQSRHYWVLAASMNIGLPILLGAFAGDMIAGFLLLGVLRLVVCHHTTFFINSLAHAFGRQPYSDESTARDNGLIALLTYGEGYHNFHHTFQWDYRNGIRWYHFDPTKWLIRGLSLCRLAWQLKTVAPERIEQAVVAMQLKRTTERISRFQPINTQQWLELIETEYEKLISTLNEWAKCRQAALALSRERLIEKWEHTELHDRLQQLEAELEFQRRQWRLLTRQFA
ncbi:MAG: acyl-CoA desaturase [Pseudomonadota bacterium]